MSLVIKDKFVLNLIKKQHLKKEVLFCRLKK